MVLSRKQFATKDGVSSNAPEGTVARWKNVLHASQVSEAAGIPERCQPASACWRFAKVVLFKAINRLKHLGSRL